MPHEIDQTTGKAAVFVTGDPPWHGLGKVIEQAATSQQAISLAGLDWTVEKWKLTAAFGSHCSPVPHHLATVRTDTGSVLGVVSAKYQIFQNRQAFDFMDSLVGEKLAMYETAGSLRGGRTVWMLARIPREYRIGPDDLIQPYILLTNCHDGSGPLRMLATTIRVVCQNTLNLALNDDRAPGVSLRHYQCLQDRVAEARTKLGIITNRLGQFNEEIQLLASRAVSSLTKSSYFRQLLPPVQTPAERVQHDKILLTWDSNFENPRNTLAGMRGSWWAAYNAVSEWSDHQRVYRGGNTRLRSESRLNSNWFGVSHQFKQRAYQSALELAHCQNN